MAVTSQPGCSNTNAIIRRPISRRLIRQFPATQLRPITPDSSARVLSDYYRFVADAALSTRLPLSASTGTEASAVVAMQSSAPRRPE